MARVFELSCNSGVKLQITLADGDDVLRLREITATVHPGSGRDTYEQPQGNAVKRLRQEQKALPDSHWTVSPVRKSSNAPEEDDYISSPVHCSLPKSQGGPVSSSTPPPVITPIHAGTKKKKRSKEPLPDFVYLLSQAPLVAGTRPLSTFDDENQPDREPLACYLRRDAANLAAIEVCSEFSEQLGVTLTDNLWRDSMDQDQCVRIRSDWDINVNEGVEAWVTRVPFCTGSELPIYRRLWERKKDSPVQSSHVNNTKDVATNNTMVDTATDVPCESMVDFVPAQAAVTSNEQRLEHRTDSSLNKMDPPLSEQREIVDPGNVSDIVITKYEREESIDLDQPEIERGRKLYRSPTPGPLPIGPEEWEEAARRSAKKKKTVKPAVHESNRIFDKTDFDSADEVIEIPSPVKPVVIKQSHGDGSDSTIENEPRPSKSKKRKVSKLLEPINPDSSKSKTKVMIDLSSPAELEPVAPTSKKRKVSTPKPSKSTPRRTTPAAVTPRRSVNPVPISTLVNHTDIDPDTSLYDEVFEGLGSVTGSPPKSKPAEQIETFTLTPSGKVVSSKDQVNIKIEKANSREQKRIRKAEKRALKLENLERGNKGVAGKIIQID